MKTILIVDDDPKILAALEIRFRGAGYKTLTAGDATTGLSQAVQRLPDLLVLDISLPAGDGLEVAEKLRKLPQTCNMPILFVTASKDPELRVKAMELAAAGLLEKPYDPEELLAVAGHALGETGSFRRRLACFSRTTPQAPAVRKVLVVEDDRKIAMALALRLRSEGYEVLVANDALSAVSTALRSLPHLVLLDISMPAGDGFGVAERINASAAERIPVIFLTASKQPGLRARAQELGAAGYFEKPYEAEHLLAAVRNEIGAGASCPPS